MNKAQIIFHPQLKLTEAAELARQQGGSLVWLGGRVRILKARHHADAANKAAAKGDHAAALGHIGEAQRQIDHFMPGKVELCVPR